MVETSASMSNIHCTDKIKTSLQKGILKRHIGLVHERKTPLECADCYAVFVETKQFTKHKR